MIKRAFVFIFCLLSLVTRVFQSAGQVVPIKWKAFHKPGPSDSLSLMERDILLNAVKYGLTTWYNDDKKFDSQTGAYLDFGGIGEYNIRPAAAEAQAIAIAIKTNIYDERLTGVSKSRAIEILLKLIGSEAYHHKVNSKGGWGDHWQSALWSAYVGTAGWLMWDELSATDKEYVQKMVEFEANRLNNYVVPYMQDKNGKVIFKGDSKSEENSWNATILHLALAMMPKHPNAKLWMNKNIELMLSANIRPQDIYSDQVFNGRKLSIIAQGSNYNADGTVTNHGRIHPDYMACTSHTFFNALVFALARKATPKAAFFNADIIYQAMSGHEFTAPPYLQPGGTIYKEGTGDIYYPVANDWGTSRRMQFALMDCQMSAFKMDKTSKHQGTYWEALHAGVVLDMQKRGSDGRTYQTPKEDTYKSREEWVAILAGQTWLTKWLLAQHKFKVTNKAY